MKYIWIVLNAEDATSQLKNWMDQGDISGVNSLYQGIQTYTNKVKSFAQEKGGSVVLSMAERLVLQLPTSAANEFEQIIEGYSETLGAPVAVGIGLTYNEAIKASNKSRHTSNTELYDPSTDSDWEASDEVSGNNGKDKRGLKRPTLKYKKPFDGRPTDKIPKMPTMEEEAKMKQELMHQMLAELGLGELQEAQQQQMEQMAQQQEEQEQMMAEQQAMPGQEEGVPPEEGQEGVPPEEGQEEAEMSRSPGTLLDALLGHTKEEEGEESPEQLEQDMGMLEQASQGQVTEEGQQMAQELEPEIDEAEESTEEVDDDPFTDKIGHALSLVHEKLPEIMSLRAQDPDGFKETMSAIVRLINASKKKHIKKTEEIMTDITKAALGTKHLHLPVGTRRKGKVKVKLPDGKTVWRSMRSGMVQSNMDGAPVSVKSHNRDALDQ